MTGLRLICCRFVVATAFALLVSDAFHPIGASAQSEPRPNILIFVTDDQRATGWLSVMPKTRKYFVRGGVTFPNTFATTPLCCPSRASIFTGRYAHNTGVRGNGRVIRLDVETTFPRLLQQAGYRTALVGKYLNSWPLARIPPYFNRWASGPRKYTDPEFNVNGTVRTVDGYSTTLVGRFAKRFLRGFESHDSAPWLLYVAPNAPHHPWKAAERDRYALVGSWGGNPAVKERDRSDKPAFVRNRRYSLADGRQVREGQLRSLMSVDHMVGRVFRTLRRLGERRRTLAIFTTDNGFLWADHHLGGTRHTAGQKRLPYTASIQLPFALRWPGHVQPGTRDGRLIGNIDIAPTMLEAARLAPDPTKPPLDGRSILSGERRARILLEYWRGRSANWIPTWRSLRTKQYQYIEYYRDDGTRFFREYYDLVHDPWQLRNLLHDGNADNDPDVAALAEQLRLDRRCSGTNGETACP
jgi:arylsulfatase A-like enzyme